MITNNITRNIERKDVYIAIALFLLAFIVRLPALHYPLSGDSVVYAELTKNLYDTGTYTIDGKLHTQYPFLFSMTSVIFMLFGDQMFAVKISAFFWASLVVVLIYLFSLRFIERKFAVVTALLTLFNPWFFYFTTALPLSEAITTFLVVLAYFLYDFEDKNKHNYLSAFCFGLAILSRYTAGLFALPFLIVKLTSIIKKSKIDKKLGAIFTKEFLSKIIPQIIFILLVLLPALLWLFFTIINTTDITNHGYIGPLLTQSSLTFSNVIYNSFLTLIIIPILLLFGMILFLAYTCFSVRNLVSIQKNYHEFHKYLLFSFCMMLLFGIFWFSIFSPYFHYIWEKLRFFVSFIPLLMLISMIGYRELFQKYIAYKKLLKITIYLFLFVSVILSSYITYGFFKEKVDMFLPSKEIFTQKAYIQSKAITAINSYDFGNKLNVQPSVIAILSEQSIRDKEHKHFKYYFDVSSVFIMNHKSEILEATEERNKLSEKILVYTEYSLDETKQILYNADISSITMTKIAEYGRVNKAAVYEIT